MSRQHDRELYNRRSLRRPDHDYFANGIYFVTIRTHERAALFGGIGEQGVALNDAGRMIANEWRALKERFENILPDMFIVMPDHLHGVLVVKGSIAYRNVKSGEKPVALGNVVQALKSITTRQYIDGVRNSGWAEFNGKVWQRNYHEHIVRNQEELDAFRTYIAGNPTKPYDLITEINDLQ